MDARVFRAVPPAFSINGASRRTTPSLGRRMGQKVRRRTHKRSPTRRLGRDCAGAIFMTTCISAARSDEVTAVHCSAAIRELCYERQALSLPRPQPWIQRPQCDYSAMRRGGGPARRSSASGTALLAAFPARGGGLCRQTYSNEDLGLKHALTLGEMQ